MRNFFLIQFYEWSTKLFSNTNYPSVEEIISLNRDMFALRYRSFETLLSHVNISVLEKIVSCRDRL